MEHFEIPQNLPAHDALNDAYFTALVAARLNVAEGIKNYNNFRGDMLSASVIGDADAGDDGYVTISEMLEDELVSSPDCPICRAKLSRLGRHLHSKGQKYSFLFECESCKKKMLLSLKLHRNFNDTWRAKRTLCLASDEKIADFLRALETHGAKRKVKTRRPRKRIARENSEPKTEE